MVEERPPVVVTGAGALLGPAHEALHRHGRHERAGGVGGGLVTVAGRLAVGPAVRPLEQRTVAVFDENPTALDRVALLDHEVLRPGAGAAPHEESGPVGRARRREAGAEPNPPDDVGVAVGIDVTEP